MALSDLSLVGEPYKYPFMELGFPNDFQLVFFHCLRKKERAKASLLPLSTLWSAKIMVRVIEWNILCVQDL